MTKIIALTGPVASGKDSVAAILREFDFYRIAFADPLYKQVSEAFSIPEHMLRDRKIKEKPLFKLRFAACDDPEFIKCGTFLHSNGGGFLSRLVESMRRRSPREILQLWGTEYRRSQDYQYWIKQAAGELTRYDQSVQRFMPRRVVFTDLRFQDELEWLESVGAEIWHVVRPGFARVNNHKSEQGIPVMDGHRVVNNDGYFSDPGYMSRFKTRVVDMAMGWNGL